MRPISKEACMDWEILENGKKVSRNRKKENTASRTIEMFSRRIRSCRFSSSLFCDSFIRHSSEAKIMNTICFMVTQSVVFFV